MCLIAPPHQVQLLQQWALAALKARGSADGLLVLASSDEAIHVARRLGLHYERLPSRAP